MSSVSLISLGLDILMARACKGLQAETQENKKARHNGRACSDDLDADTWRSLVKPVPSLLLRPAQLLPLFAKEGLKGLPQFLVNLAGLRHDNKA